MKDYLKEELSKEERLIILGLIWKVARKYKLKKYNEGKKYLDIIDDIDLSTEDSYSFYSLNSHYNIMSVHPLTDEEKSNIVMDLDTLLRELRLFKLIRTLTFNEKLVFFLYYMEDFKNVHVSIFLSNTEKTILSRRKSIDRKIEEVKGDFKYERGF